MKVAISLQSTSPAEPAAGGSPRVNGPERPRTGPARSTETRTTAGSARPGLGSTTLPIPRPTSVDDMIARQRAQSFCSRELNGCFGMTCRERAQRPFRRLHQTSGELTLPFVQMDSRLVR
jgi:hypothetical protein